MEPNRKQGIGWSSTKLSNLKPSRRHKLVREISRQRQYWKTRKLLEAHVGEVGGGGGEGGGGGLKTLRKLPKGFRSLQSKNMSGDKNEVWHRVRNGQAGLVRGLREFWCKEAIKGRRKRRKIGLLKASKRGKGMLKLQNTGTGTID